MARIDYAHAEDLPAAYQDLLVSALQGKPVNVYSAIGNNPEVLYGIRTFLGSLWQDSGLDDQSRELAILTVSREAPSPYEWHQHVNVARDVGISDAEIRAIGAREYDAFDDPEALLLTYVRAVLDDEVTDELHDQIAERYSEATIVGIVGLVGGYFGLSRMLSAFDVETEDSFVGWELEAEE
ncbi:carboxymuconolactone decarboxylase family protein [Halalkalirubrum salinum]|uniref:carboxymuconolactone decarboxylase family protein n=1 Tax=Halalkalirubrum salinum TaxID=2563889 RepID=UPI0010FB076D|nr:carboxymuconolactone decarboxylase family protein [Halalkalirubrum salinum]